MKRMQQEAEQTEHRTLAEACKRSPNGVICLLPTLRFHNITTQAPFEIWIAHLGTARIDMQVDIGFGDVVHPAGVEIEFPTLLTFKG